jgi:hypothetical protein
MLIADLLEDIATEVDELLVLGVLVFGRHGFD